MNEQVTTENNHVCPICNGFKEIWSIVFYGTSGTSIECDLCLGTGGIDAEVMQRYTYGRARRKERIQRHLGFRREAETIGVSAGDLSRAERGVLSDGYERWKAAALEVSGEH